MGILDFFFGKNEEAGTAKATPVSPIVPTGRGSSLATSSLGIQQKTLSEQKIANERDAIYKTKAKENIRSTIPKDVFSGDDDEEIVEAIFATGSREAEKRYINKQEATSVPGPLKEAVMQTGQFIEGGASVFGDLLQGGLKLAGAKGKLVEPVTSRQIFDRHKEYLRTHAPDRLQEYEDMLELEGYSPIAQTTGAMAEILGEGFVTGSAITRTLRAVPAMAKMRSAGRGGIYMANILENAAASIATNVQYGVTRGQKPEEITRSIAANPSVLLPLSSKLVVGLGGGADFLAAKALGYTTEDALFNAALGAGSNLAQRQGMKGEFDVLAIKKAFIGRFKGPKPLAEAVWNENSTIHSYATQNPHDIKGIEKMQVESERRLLKLAKTFETGTTGKTGEARPARLTGPEAPGEPLPPKGQPEAPKTPQDELEQLEQMIFQREMALEALSTSPTGENADLHIYTNKVEGELPEVTGKRDTTVFGQRGDQIATALGWADHEDMRRNQELITRERRKLKDLRIRKANKEIEIRQARKGQLESKAMKPKLSSPEEAKAAFESYENLDEQILGPTKTRTPSQKIGGVKGGVKSGVRDILKTPEPELEFSPKMRQEADAITQGVTPYKQSTEIKELSPGKGMNRDLWRNIERTFGEGTPESEAILRPFEDAKKSYVDMQERLTNELNSEIVQKLGIQKGSKLSGEVQKYGELPQASDKANQYKKLVTKFGKTKADSVVTADTWFRKKYDEMIDTINTARRDIYGDNPEQLIQKRADYYRHFQEMQEGYAALINAFETPSGISPGLSGVSADTSPKSKFLSIKQKRLGGETEVDAVGGFLNYAKQASYATNIDPQIARFRALHDSLVERVGGDEGSPHLNRLIKYIHEYANELSGKTGTIDRGAVDLLESALHVDGRKALRVVDWTNTRVKKNAILGNVGSSVAQAFNVPQGIASANAFSIPGAARTLADVVGENPQAKRSPFLRERYLERSLYTRFDRGMLKNTEKFAAWMTGVLDEAGTRFIWNSHYYQGLAKKVPDPIRYADRITRKMVAGRGVGEVPLIYKSKFLQVVAPFQLEVGNLWHVMGDMASQKDKAKALGQITTLFVVNFLMNETAEKIRGSRVVLDPINAAIDIAKEYDPKAGNKRNALMATGRAAGEIVGNIPFGQTFANAIFTEEQKKAFFGQADISRYGTPLLIGRASQNPAYRFLPPFGGAQAEKTVKGIKLLRRGGQESKSGKTLTYPAPKADDLMEKIKAILFGPSSTKAAKEYYDKGAKGYYKKVGGKPSKPSKPKKPTKPRR